MAIHFDWGKMSKQPRILHFSALTLSQGGIETFLINLTKALSSHYEIVIASAGNQGFQDRIREVGGQTAAWTNRSLLDTAAFREFHKLLERECPDLIHIHDARAGWVGRLALATRHIPIIMTSHLPSYYYRHERFSQLWNLSYALIETIFNRILTTKVIYPSLSSYQYALKWGIISAHKALYIPNGIDTRLFSIEDLEKRNAFRAQMGISPEQPVICALGRLSIEKNFSLIIKAFAEVQAKFPTAILWIVGDGPERMNLENQVQKGRLEKAVYFLGAQLNVDLPLNACDIFMLASWYEGGRTLAVMEAQAAGKPCIVSQVGDLPQMVEDGIHGFVFPEGNIKACAQALENLLSNATQRIEMGQAARRKALVEYNIENMTNAYDALYKSLLAA